MTIYHLTNGLSETNPEMFDMLQGEAEYLSGLPDLEGLLEDEAAAEEPTYLARPRTGGICPSCGGDGLFKRPTPYTENGKPICFRCWGSGRI